VFTQEPYSHKCVLLHSTCRCWTYWLSTRPGGSQKHFTFVFGGRGGVGREAVLVRWRRMRGGVVGFNSLIAASVKGYQP
jgi:hypothetical protein